MQTSKWIRCAAIAVTLSLSAGSAAAQGNDETRPASSTFLGDTGLWFVPTAEVLAGGAVSGSGHVATFNREQGFTALQSMAGTFAVGVGERLEVFGSVEFSSRIDRDLRPLFQPGQARVGGLVPGYPLVTNTFSGNELGDTVIGAKINLLSERTLAPYALAIRGYVKLPTGDKGAGTTTGEPDGAIGLVVSKNLGGAELAGHYDFVIRKDPATIDLPHSMRWGVGFGAPVRGPVRVFGEVLSEVLLDDSIALTVPLFGADGSLSGLASPQRTPLDLIVGAQWQGPMGVSVGGGLTWAARHVSRSTVGASSEASDRIGFLFRLNYHPGVRVYVPPPPPPPPPDAPNRPPTVSITCDPCVVEYGETVNLRADASDPDGDPLTYRWNAPTGSFQDAADRATTRWQAPNQEGPVPISVTVADGRGGSASDTTNIRVNAPPAPPAREYVFEDVHFDFDRYNLRPGATRVLDEVIAALQEDANLRIEIEGHTCNIGTNEYNLALGDRRANSVEDYLTSRGIGANRLQTVTYGEERPAYDNSREETRRLNRRAALVVRVQ